MGGDTGDCDLYVPYPLTADFSKFTKILFWLELFGEPAPELAKLTVEGFAANVRWDLPVVVVTVDYPMDDDVKDRLRARADLQYKPMG